MGIGIHYGYRYTLRVRVYIMGTGIHYGYTLLVYTPKGSQYT